MSKNHPIQATPGSVMTVRTAAKTLAVCRRTIEAMIKSGALRAVKYPSGAVRIDRASVEALLAREVKP